MEFTDTKLDTYISKLKDPETSGSDFLLTYKKATKRIDMLKTKYNRIVSVKKKGSESDSDTESESEPNDFANMSVEELLTALAAIRTDLEAETTDINELIKLYAKYNSAANILKTKHTELQNKFYKVDANKKDITVTKVDLDSIL